MLNVVCCRIDVKEFGAHLGEDFGDFVRCPYGRSGLENDDVPFAHIRSDGSGRGDDVIDVGRRAGAGDIGMVKRRRYSEDEDIGFGGDGVGFELAGVHSRTDKGIELGLDDMDLSAVDRIYSMLIDIDTVDVVAAVCQQRCGGQTDISQTDDTDFFICMH